MIGQTISHYKILDKLGEGGMGVVYKAQDTNLDRLVALKFLPEHVSANSGDLERFVQEAKAAASLNHPNICTIHGIEESDGKNFIVMEFVDGQTLQEKKSALSMKQALDIGIQIAEGLAAAHEKGIVHRDIKPENIMIRKDGRVQVMDFGLAKLRGASRLTREGSTVGTAGYMSPEQVQGQETDHRSDIFSLGVLLFELLSGQLLYKGVHETAIAYEIVNVDSPPMSSLKPEIPPELDAIVLECLEKDPKERTQSASQVAVDLKRYKRESSRQRASRIMPARTSSSQSGIAETVNSQSGWKERNPHLLKIVSGSALIFFLGLVVALIALWSNSKPEAQTIKSVILPAREAAFFTNAGGHIAISPDGSMLAFLGRDSSGELNLWLRNLNSDDVRILPGTQGALYPFWSPDSKMIGFFADEKLKKIDASGGFPLTIAPAPAGRGGAWNQNGVIIYSPSLQGNLLKVSASGGVPSQVTNIDTASKRIPRFPSFLPDGKHFTYVTLLLEAGTSPLRSDYETFVGSLDGGEPTPLLTGVSNMMYASGHLLYLRQTVLTAQQFDLSSFQFMGGPVPIAASIHFWPERAKGDFSVSQNGILVYQTSSDLSNDFYELRRNGAALKLGALALSTDAYGGASTSYGWKKILYGHKDFKTGNRDIWSYDMVRGMNTRLTFDEQPESSPVWSPDNSSFIFVRGGYGAEKLSIIKKQADGGGAEEIIFTTLRDYGIAVTDWTRDGKYLLTNFFTAARIGDIMILALDGKKEPTPFATSEFNESVARVSPDGKWVAYVSDESGVPQLYVRPFSGKEGKWQLSSSSVGNVYWSKSGREIVYQAGARVFAIEVSQQGSSFAYGTPRQVSDLSNLGSLAQLLGVSEDGQRFLVNSPTGADLSQPVDLIVNWQTDVEKQEKGRN